MSVARNVFQLDRKPTWFENIAIRPNGGILVTRLDVPEVMEVDPVTGAGRSIFSVQGITCLTGINELTLDVFAVGGGDYNFQSGAVNGLKVREENGVKYVYFTSTMRELFARVPVDDSIHVAGPVEEVSSGFMMDDFCFGADGSAYVVTHPTNMVMRVPPKGGEAVRIAGDHGSFDVACGTSCAVGRAEGDKGVLYVCTGGANSAPINGETEPAKVVAITLDG